MGKIFYMMGKSASGKDTLYQELLHAHPDLFAVTLYTTRPIREGEQDGVEYHFVTKERLDAYGAAGKLIEMRTYHTVCGDWSYATVDDGQIRLDEKSYLMIGTLESYSRMKAYFGQNALTPIYLEVEDGERLARAVNRERRQKEPHFDEVCRRFLADQKDFSEDNLEKAGITKRFQNEDATACLAKIEREIYK